NLEHSLATTTIMPITRGQEAATKNALRTPVEQNPIKVTAKRAPRSKKAAKNKEAPLKETPAAVGEKREADQVEDIQGKGKEETDEQPPTKKAKTEEVEDTHDVAEGSREETEHASSTKIEVEKGTVESGAAEDNPVNTTCEKNISHMRIGTIERGHIYFFYRPRVELEEAHSIDDVQRFHILLIPRPPEFASDSDEAVGASIKNAQDEDEEAETEMALLQPGADVVPSAEPTNLPKKHFRLLMVGKKGLPDPEQGGKGGGRKQIFWATVATVGEDLKKLEEGLGARTYETKTRGTRHQSSARLAARGAYAIVNSEARTPSARETHLGYYLSHPTPENFGEVQTELGIRPSSSFVLQVKNPLAPPTGIGRVGLPSNRRAKFPSEIMKHVFGQAGGRGREDFGLRFASVERREMLDYEGAELLFIAATTGEEGLEKSLGEGRGAALQETEKSESKESIQQVLKELATDAEKIPADPLEGEWA
ncbi:hypothetical protein A0H81_01472, partial [Grifola frondosa]